MPSLTEHLDKLLQRSADIERALILSVDGEVLAQAGSYYAPADEALKFIAKTLNDMQTVAEHLEFNGMQLMDVMFYGKFRDNEYIKIFAIDCLDAKLIIWTFNRPKIGLIWLEVMIFIENICRPKY